jgi:hypothetical protein
MAVNIGGISYVHVSYRGSLSALGAALSARGWTVENVGSVIRISGNGGPPPPRPAPQPPAQQPQPAPAAPASGQTAAAKPAPAKP